MALGRHPLLVRFLKLGPVSDCQSRSVEDRPGVGDFLTDVQIGRSMALLYHVKHFFFQG